MARDYQYIDSVACYGEFSNDGFHRLAESRHEVWFGDDGSGLVRSQRIRSVFFTEDQRLRWETRPNRAARESTEPSLDLYAAGCFHGPRRELSQLPTDRVALQDHLLSRRQLSLNSIHQLIGNAIVPPAQRQMLFDLAADLPDAWILPEASDQLNRPGVAIARVERKGREELIFDPETLQLLGYRQTLISFNPEYAAPAGAVTGWTSYVDRQIVDALPADTPPVPQPPCDSSSGRGTAIRPGLLLGTGHFADLPAQLDQWLAAGVITETDHKTLQPPT